MFMDFLLFVFGSHLSWTSCYVWHTDTMPSCYLVLCSFEQVDFGQLIDVMHYEIFMYELICHVRDTRPPPMWSNPGCASTKVGGHPRSWSMTFSLLVWAWSRAPEPMRRTPSSQGPCLKSPPSPPARGCAAVAPTHPGHGLRLNLLLCRLFHKIGRVVLLLHVVSGRRSGHRRLECWRVNWDGGGIGPWTRCYFGQ